MKGSSFVDLLIEFLLAKLVRHVDMLMHAHPIENRALFSAAR